MLYYIAEWFSKMMQGVCLYCKNVFRKREKKRKFCSLSCASRFNQNGVNKVILPRYSKKLAEFVGICLGDGCAVGYQVSVTLNARADCEYIPYVEELASALFPGATVSHVKRKDNAIDVRIFSYQVVAFMKKMGIVSRSKFVPLWIVNTPAYRKACIRGLFDTEGSISFKMYKNIRGVSLYKQLNFRSTSKDLMRFMRDGLVFFGFKPTVTLKKSLYLSNHTSIEIFQKTIGFSNPKLVKRSVVKDPASFERYMILKNQTA